MLKYRRMRGDMIEVFKIFTGKYGHTKCTEIYNIQYTRAGNPSFEHAVRLTPAYGLVRLSVVLSGSVNPGQEKQVSG